MDEIHNSIEEKLDRLLAEQKIQKVRQVAISIALIGLTICAISNSLISILG